MLTAQGKKILSVTPNALPFNGVAGLIEVKDITNGTVLYTNGRATTSNPYAMGMLTTNYINVTTASVIIGSGGTPATEADYMLESIYLGGYTSSNTNSTAISDDNTTFYVNYDYIVTNTSESEMTIREIGRYIPVYTVSTKGATAATSGSQNRTGILVDRTVLETPVVIPSGESATVRYQFAYDVS